MLQRGVVVLGSTTIDRIVQADRVSCRVGGVTTYAGLTYRKHGVPTTVVTNVACEDEPILQKLSEEGIIIHRGFTEKTTHFTNVIHGDDRRQEAPFVAAPITCDQIHDILNNAELLHLGPLHPEDIAPEALRWLKASPVFICLDVQGYVREIRNLKVYPVVSEYLRDALEVATVLKASQPELYLILDDYELTLPDFMESYGVEELLVTRGSQGGFVRMMGGHVTEYAAETIEAPIDAIGAGDVFFATYLVQRFFRGKDPANATCRAALEAARQVEGKYISPGHLLLEYPWKESPDRVNH
jgi:sugar/nucleoside kinase (ribokinase family)